MIGPGQLVGGRYRIVERVGAGAMGVVWRAMDERLHRTVAVKQLSLSLDPVAAAEARQRLLREGRIAARLHHPNAISVFDVADHGGAPWLVMEYLPSRSLAAVLAERGPLPPREVAEIGRQIADALAAAHAAGVVHRDVKPANVLLGENGLAKLTDFGISRAADDVTLTRTGVLSGTPAYLAPEVARGADPSPASDVFALGSTLYTAVEGQPPFGRNDNALALLHSVAGGQVLPPRQAGPLTSLLMRLLRTSPRDRPTMAEARDALAAVAAGEPQPNPIPPEHTRQLEPAPDERRERRPALLVTAGVALAVLAGLVLLAATTGPADPVAKTPAPQTPAPQTPAPQMPAEKPPTSAASTPVTSTTATTTARPAPTAAELQRAVAAYYGLLPNHPDRAWARLSPALRAQGYEVYADFWDGIDAVQAVPTTADPGSMTVRVLLVYRRDDRRPQAELHDLVLVRDGEALLIDRDDRLGATAAPTTRKRRG